VDDSSIRAAAVAAGIGCITTRAGISAILSALAAMHRGDYGVKSIQEHHEFRKPAATDVVRAGAPAAPAART